MQIRFSGPFVAPSPARTGRSGVMAADRATFSGKTHRPPTADELFETGKDLALGRNGRQRDPGLAIRYFEAASTYPHKKALNIARFYLNEFQPASISMAGVFLEKAVEEPTFTQTTRFEVVDIYVGKGMNDRATAVLRRIVEDDPAFSFEAGKVFAEKLNDPENAARCFEKAAKNNSAFAPQVYDILQNGLGALKPDPELAAELAARYPKLDY